jgi:hypothetical protein
MTEEGVSQMWASRQGGSVRTSSYGTGTFILGKQKALNWIGADDASKDEPDAAAEPRPATTSRTASRSCSRSARRRRPSAPRRAPRARSCRRA